MSQVPRGLRCPYRSRRKGPVLTRLGVVGLPEEHQNGSGSEVTVDVEDAADVEKFLADVEGSGYVEAVVQLAEQSERTYRAAVMAGKVVNGFSDSTNY
jgi:hypothetical protein